MSVEVKLRGTIPDPAAAHTATIANIEGGYEGRCTCGKRERLLIPDGVPMDVFLNWLKSFNRRHPSRRRRARPT